MPMRLIAFLIVLAVCSAAPAQEMVPFVIPAEPSEKSLIAAPPLPPIAPDGPRLIVKDGQFSLGGKRYRVWGMNMCFGGCFPDKEDARRVAARLAAAGVNSIRFHHMDSANYPRGIWRKGSNELSEEALVRLDTFIDQLAKRGITSNINLHVGALHSRRLGLPETAMKYDKMAGIFTPQLVAAQKKYARDLLGRVNTVRKVRYADDAAVAFVEITNENSLFMWGSKGYLQNGMPDHYRKILTGQFNAWLKKRYGTSEKLRAAWGGGATKLGKNLAGSAWELERHGGCKGQIKSLAKPAGAVRVQIEKHDDQDWHLQFRHAGFGVKRREYYTLSFRARADKPRTLSVRVGQAHEPWGELGLAQDVKLTTEWQGFRLGFVARQADNNARVAFQLGGDGTSVEFADLQLRSGGREGLAAGETLEAGSIALYGGGETSARGTDRMRFYAETEKAYFDGMKRFVRKDLGCKALIAGTIVMGALGLWAQGDMDFIDTHAYWQHPHFPGKPWDPNNWTVEQKAMTDDPARSTLFDLAASRLAGKPYTVSEYNHPAPNDYQAECVPMLASFAAAQDWDGVWLFTYSNGEHDANRKQFRSYFDMDFNSAKWGFMRAGAAMFHDGGIEPLQGAVTIDLSGGKDLLADLADLQQAHARKMMRTAEAVDGKLKLEDLPKKRFYLTWDKDAPAPRSVPGPLSEILWRGRKGKAGKGEHGTYSVQGAGAVIVVGSGTHVLMPSKQAAARLSLALRKPELPVVTLTSLDAKPFAETNVILLAACGRSENTGMKFSADRRTVGRNWGGPPVQIETVEGTLVLSGKWRCVALTPDGTAGADVPVTHADGATEVKFSGRFKTMWYLLTRQK